MKWAKVEAGHYYAHARGWNDGPALDMHVKLIDGNWQLEVNGAFKGYFGRKASAQARAEDLTAKPWSI